MYVVSGVAVSATLMFDYVAVRLRGCGYDSAGDIVITGSFWAKKVNVLSQFLCQEVLGPTPFVMVFLL